MHKSILNELHATREKLLDEADGDLHQYVEEARQRALESGRVIAAPTQRTMRSTGAAVDACSEIPSLSPPD